MRWLQRLRYFLQWALKPFIDLRPPKPGAITVKLKGENQMLNYQITYPAPTSPDVVGWNLSVTIDGAVDERTGELSESVIKFSAMDGQLVELSFAFVDDAGNVSTPRSLSFVAKDTIPPDAPEDFQVTLVSET